MDDKKMQKSFGKFFEEGNNGNILKWREELENMRKHYELMYLQKMDINQESIQANFMSNVMYIIITLITIIVSTITTLGMQFFSFVDKLVPQRNGEEYVGMYNYLIKELLNLDVKIISIFIIPAVVYVCISYFYNVVCVERNTRRKYYYQEIIDILNEEIKKRCIQPDLILEENV